MVALFLEEISVVAMVEVEEASSLTHYFVETLKINRQGINDPQANEGLQNSKSRTLAVQSRVPFYKTRNRSSTH